MICGLDSVFCRSPDTSESRHTETGEFRIPNSCGFQREFTPEEVSVLPYQLFLVDDALRKPYLTSHCSPPQLTNH